MQELVGRLKALDAEATESLKVIAYFDALIDGHASTQMLLRGAAVLSGCAAGFTADGTASRVDATGVRSPGPPANWPSHAFGHGGSAWIERDGPAHANDAMILERLAIALGIASDRTPAAASRRAIQVLIDTDSPPEARLDAATRLRLTARTHYRAIATPADVAVIGPSVVISTSVGAVRAAIQAADEQQRPERAGIGLSAFPDALDESWESALIALRLSSPRERVVTAEQLGAVLLLAKAADATPLDTPDLVVLSALIHAEPRAAAVLESIAGTDSLRAVAGEVGLHHSTVQTKTTHFAQVLGFDLRSPQGRVRLSLALTLHRLGTTRFDTP